MIAITHPGAPVQMTFGDQDSILTGRPHGRNMFRMPPFHVGGSLGERRAVPHNGDGTALQRAIKAHDQHALIFVSNAPAGGGAQTISHALLNARRGLRG